MKLLNFNALVLEGKKKLLFKKIQFKNELKKNQVLVKIFYSGICGKQIEEYTYQKGKDKFLPHLLGHEGSGKIVKVGPGVKSLKKGDYVVLHWMRNKSIKDCDTPYFYDSNLKKRNYINKHKNDITISILSENPSDWEIEEKRLIKENLKYNLFNICEGGLNNFKKTKQINLTPREHLQQANLALKKINKMIFKRRGIENRFSLLTKEEIDRICQY
jgi:hypothetical protein